MSARTFWHANDLHGDSADAKPSGLSRVRAEPAAANLVSSLCDDGMHRPALDIDLPCRLVESSTPGHFHLYIDKPMPWESYRALLAILADVGIIEPGYYRASVERGMTYLRTVPKVADDISYEQLIDMMDPT